MSGPGKLGRIVNHDPLSRAFRVTPGAPLRTVLYKRNVPIFDQGDLGSCCGNALAGTLSTSPFSWAMTEDNAVELYSAATAIDGIAGTYPPDDTGSSGLAVMKAAQDRSLISAYVHGFSIDDALSGLMVHGPGITGFSWREGCDNPDSTGLVKYVGAIRGGHELSVVGLDIDTRRVRFAQSWGEDWGDHGYFDMSIDDWALALSDQGDVTFPIC